MHLFVFSGFQLIPSLVCGDFGVGKLDRVGVWVWEEIEFFFRFSLRVFLGLDEGYALTLGGRGEGGV